MIASIEITDMGTRPSVKQIGFKAHRCMTATRFSGTVIAAGSRAVFIATEDGDLLAACPIDQQPHPRSFLTDLDLSSLHEGLRAWYEDEQLRFGDGASLEMNASQVWYRPSAVPPCVTPRQALLSRCNGLLEVAQNAHDGENLGLALSSFAIDGRAPTPSSPTPYISPLIIAGIEIVDELAPICRLGDLEPALTVAKRLIGLGPGLTPSGDDFVGGLLFMVRHLNAAYPQERWWQEGNIGGLLAHSETMTSRISHALLSDLAEGQSHESLHDLAEELVVDDEKFDAASHVRRVTKLGQSSGWDILTGMLAGLLPVIHRA
ncbi:MAG: DUF2877 domain-containing protein [SAR202 cluster bacterium]|nr:DUF2877 domain-containing protein [SAR202 cluster bacterium]|tara:strand:+ start:1568 stop:2524 length:957 start_codon:yes stop_codon:yes gene_type:complete